MYELNIFNYNYIHCLQMYEIWKCSAGWHPPSWRSPAGCCQGWGARWPWSMSGTWSQLRGTKLTTRRRSHFYDALRISKYWNIFTFHLPWQPHQRHESVTLPLQHSKADKIVVGVLLPRNVRDSSDVVAKESVNTQSSEASRIIEDNICSIW